MPRSEEHRLDDTGGSFDGTIVALRHDRLVFAALATASGIIWFPTTAIVVALASLQADFGTSLSGLAWIPNAYMLALSAVLLLAGRLGTRLGARSSLTGGAVAFGLAAAAAAVAPDYAVLVAAAAVLGVSAAFVTTASLAAVRDRYAGDDATRAVAWWAAASALGQALGMPVGGLLASSPLTWRSIFALCVPAAILIAVVARRSLDSRRGDPVDLDLGGGVAAGVALSLTVLVGTQGPEWGWTTPITLGLATLAAVAVVLAVLLIRRAPVPVAPFTLLRRPAFAGGTMLNGVLNLCLAGVLFLMPLYLEGVYDDTARRAGVLLLGITAPAVAASSLGGRVGVRWGYRGPLTLAPALTASGTVLLAVTLDADRFAALVPGLIVAGAGVGLTGALALAGAIREVPTEDTASASSLFMVGALVSATIGVALAAGLLTAFGGPDATALSPAELTSGVQRSLAVFAAIAAVGIPTALGTMGGRTAAPE